MFTKETESSILFIHGAGGTKNKWRRLLQHIDVPYIAIDLPGRDKQGKDQLPSIEAYAQVLSETIGQQKVVVVGHSMGGLIGIELASRSKQVVGLVLLASHYRLPVHPSILDQLRQGQFPDFLFYASYAKGTEKLLLQEERADLDRVAIESVYSDFANCNNYDGQSSFASLNIPILAIYGEKDKLLPKDAKEQLLAANKEVVTHHISDSGHYLILEKAVPTAKAVASFFENVSV